MQGGSKEPYFFSNSIKGDAYVKLPRRSLFCVGSLLLCGGSYRYYRRSVGTRTARVRELAAFLRGQSPEVTVKVFGNRYRYSDFVNLLLGSLPELPSSQAAQALMRSAAAVIEAEDGYGTSLDVVPEIESLDQWLERLLRTNVPISASYGWGQVRAQTALRVVQKHAVTVRAALPRLARQVDALPEKATDAQVAAATDMFGDGNIFLACLVLAECFEACGYVAASKPSYDPADQRTFELACAAYFGRVYGPLVAKAQTWHNELSVLCPGYRGRAIDVDGGFGPDTATSLAQLSAHAGVPLPGELVRLPADTANGETAAALCSFLSQAEPAWRAGVVAPAKRGLSPRQIAQLVPNRASLVRLLCNLSDVCVGRGAAGVAYAEYVEDRDGPLLDLCGDGRITERLARAAPQVLERDARLPGLLPTAVGRWRFGDRPNVWAKAELASQFDTASQKRETPPL